MTSRGTPLSRPSRPTRIKSYDNNCKLKHLTLTKDTRWQWNILIPLDWSDTVTSSFTKTSVSTVRNSLGKTVCTRLSSTPLSAGWERIFEKQIPDSCGHPLKECFEFKYVKSILFHFPMKLVCKYSLITQYVYVLFQSILFSFNCFLNLNQIHRKWLVRRMKNAKGNPP